MSIHYSGLKPQMDPAKAPKPRNTPLDLQASKLVEWLNKSYINNTEMLERQSTSGFLTMQVATTVTIVLSSILIASVESAAVQKYDSNFVGEGTNDLATTLLQGFVEEEKNFVFSPLGYSSILAILSEGARGETRKQLVSLLHLPEDTYAVRKTYKTILEGLKEKWTLNKPEFKNWFYVYKNYSIDQNYKDILVENYLTEVKSVDRVHNELNFDLNESTEIKPDPTKETPIEENVEENINVEKEDNKKQIPKENDKSKPIVSASARSYNRNQDIASILSANKIVGRNASDSGLNPNSKMIIFNGLFFRGSWATPFKITEDKDETSFYKSKDEKIPVVTMQAKGTFQVGEITELDCEAIELPYEGDRYSLLVLLPNSRDGLPKLVSDLTGYSLNKVYKDLDPRPVDVNLPKFSFQTISDPKNALEKYGVTDIFSEKADLSGITSEELRLGELVQMVTVQVDEGQTDANYLTATDVGLRADFDTFKADHPFLFFIRDRTNNVIVVAGKVMDPTCDNSIF